MGLNISPSIWQSYINIILNCLQIKKYCEAIIEDLLLFTPSKISHIVKLEDFLRALLKNGLKISPKKCQLLETILHYMGNEIFIQNIRLCIKPLRKRLYYQKQSRTYHCYKNRLLELIGSYIFNLYYIKGKDISLSDFLSRENNGDSNPHEIITISFNMHKVLHENYYDIDLVVSW